MAPDSPTEDRDTTSTAATSAAAPAGTTAVVVYSDPRCPWARVAVRRLLAAVARRGLDTELTVDHRWFPLSDEATPADGAALDRRLEPFRSLEPDAAWHRWSDGDARFPDSSRLAATWIQAAKRVSPQASVALDGAIRDALFADGRDIAEEDVLTDLAAGVPDVDLEVVRAEVASGRPLEELDRHVEVAATDEVPASPTVVLTDGTTWTNPGIEFHTEDGVPQIDADDPEVYDEIIDAFLALRHYD